MGRYALAFTINLEEIVIPDSVVTMESGVFEGCKRLKKVTLPKKLKEIPARGFANTALEKIVFPDTLEVIWPEAFMCEFVDYSSLTEEERHIWSELSEIVIPESVKMIAQKAFYGRENLETIHFLTEELEFFNFWVFDETAWYEAQPDGIVTIGKYIYSYKGEMPENYSLTIPSGIKGIAGDAFCSRNNLVRVEIPEGTQLLGERIFQYCNQLREVILPEGLTAIHMGTFGGTSALEEIVLPGTINKIGNGAFAGSGLKKIKIPSSVKEIGGSAFINCFNLTDVYMEDGVEIIGVSVFRDCENLVNIRIPKTLKILAATFKKCAASEVVIPSSIEKIGTSFEDCPNLSKIFYEGTPEQWEKLVEEEIVHNPQFVDIEVYFYSEEAPTEDGNFWHYVDEKPVIW